MDARTRDSLLWGLVGALSFLVLAQGYRLIAGEGLRLPVLLGIAIVVWAIAALASSLLTQRLDGKRRV